MQPSVSCETCKCLAGARGGRRGGSNAGCADKAAPSCIRSAGCADYVGMRSASLWRTQACGCCDRPIATGRAPPCSVALAPDRLTLNSPAAHTGIAYADRLALGCSTASAGTPLAERGISVAQIAGPGRLPLPASGPHLGLRPERLGHRHSEIIRDVAPHFRHVAGVCGAALPCCASLSSWFLAQPEHRLAEGR